MTKVSRNLDGSPNTSGVITSSLRDGKWVKEYLEAYVCADCAKEVTLP